jgi:reactive chlorine resistance protein C
LIFAIRLHTMHLLTQAGWQVSRYGLALILGWYGVFKFTEVEAVAIEPLLAHSPMMAWLLWAFGMQGASNLIGTIEIATALAIAARPFSARIAFYGSLMAVLTFVGTLSFLATTPKMFTWPGGFLVPNGFIFKDLSLLGFALLAAGEAWEAMANQKKRQAPLAPAQTHPPTSPR